MASNDPPGSDGRAHAAHGGAGGAVSRRDDDTGSGPITWHTMAGASLVRIVGDVDLDVTAALREVLDAAVTAHAWVIVDVSRGAIVDSVALSVLVSASSVARRRGGGLLLAAPSRFLRAVLQSSRQAAAFTVFDTVPQAMTAALTSRHVAPGRPDLPRQRALLDH